MGKMYNPVMTKTIYRDRKIGDFTYGHPKIVGGGVVEIGKFCSIADGVTFLADVDHRPDWCTTYPFSAIFHEASGIPGHPAGKGPIIIGHDVWIGHHATILSGVTVGHGAVIGACSVVTKNVAPYSIVAGNPASHRKYRMSEELRDDFLRKLKWWDWPIETIIERIEFLLAEPGDQLVQFYINKYGGPVVRKEKKA